jgi:hypothetical protein
MVRVAVLSRHPAIGITAQAAREMAGTIGVMESRKSWPTSWIYRGD